MKVLGIETSCDETAAAVVENEVLLSSIVASQVELHARYGGIVPEVASRQHILSITPVIEKAMEKSGIPWEGIEAIAVTVGPGLAGSLLVGVNVAKALALARSVPLVGINHLEAHIYAAWVRDPGGTADPPPPFPILCLIVSGGHTELVLMEGHGRYRLVGRTRDDAAGEALDKGARVLGLGYPGGPAIEKAARDGHPRPRLPRAWLKGSDDFSFSGLKTALVRLVRESSSLPPRADIAASFQQAIVDVLSAKTVEIAIRKEAKAILLTGGVAANELLRNTLRQRSPIPVVFPPLPLCTDNAAMVAVCGYFKLLAGHKDGWDLEVQPNLALSRKPSRAAHLP